MSRILKISSFGLAAAFAINAAQFQVALSTNLAFSTSVNATTACAGATQNASGYNGCVAGSAVGTSSTNLQGGNNWNSIPTYSSNLFSGANSAAAPGSNASSFAPASSYNVADPYTSGGVNLSLPSTSTVWMGAAGTNSGQVTTLIVPVAIKGANVVWTMLQDAYGVNGNSYTEVSFNFGSQSNSTSGLTTITYDLKTGREIRDAVACTGVSASFPSATTSNCSSYAQNTTAGSSANAVNLGTGVAVYSTQLTQSSYAGDARAGSYLNTAGTVQLDAQRFDFLGQHTNDWLVSISITSLTGGAFYGGSSLVNTSRTALSAITVSTDTAPEPSTWAMIAGGLGVLGWVRRRRTA